MLQFVADQIDQLDLALDQLAIGDRNFDRFALMLIDNMVELTLHQHAREKANENQMWRHEPSQKNDPKTVSAALGQSFEAKIKLARATLMVTPQIADSLQYLHGFRNTVYHQGTRHEGILHSLALMYLRHACAVLEGLEPMWWSTGSADKISHRAIKYIGTPSLFKGKAVLVEASTRILEVANSLGNTLIDDLSTDMLQTVDRVDGQIDFLATDAPQATSRRKEIISAQVWPFAFSDEGKQWAQDHGYTNEPSHTYVEWLTIKYPWPIRTDPVPSWRKRHLSLKSESNNDVALKKYCDFIRQTEAFRSQIDESASQLDSHIQQQIDLARGK